MGSRRRSRLVVFARVTWALLCFFVGSLRDEMGRRRRQEEIV